MKGLLFLQRPQGAIPGFAGCRFIFNETRQLIAFFRLLDFESFPNSMLKMRK
jgi:hypothetical protein